MDLFRMLERERAVEDFIRYNMENCVLEDRHAEFLLQNIKYVILYRERKSEMRRVREHSGACNGNCNCFLLCHPVGF